MKNWMDEWTNGWMDGWMNGWANELDIEWMFHKLLDQLIRKCVDCLMSSLNHIRMSTCLFRTHSFLDFPFILHSRIVNLEMFVEEGKLMQPI
jgi:hypothetical protein